MPTLEQGLAQDIPVTMPGASSAVSSSQRKRVKRSKPIRSGVMRSILPLRDVYPRYDYFFHAQPAVGEQSLALVGEGGAVCGKEGQQSGRQAPGVQDKDSATSPCARWRKAASV